MKVLKNRTSLFFKTLKLIISFIIKKQHIFYMSFPLVTMDIVTRIYGSNIDFYNITGISPNLFTLSWLFLFIGIAINTKNKYN